MNQIQLRQVSARATFDEFSRVPWIAPIGGKITKYYRVYGKELE